MRILVALIAVFMVSGAVAQKKPTGYTGGGTWTCQVIGEVQRRPSFQCKDPKTGKTQKVQCKTPPKQKLPDKVTLAELDKACSLRSDNRF